LKSIFQSLILPLRLAPAITIVLLGILLAVALFLGVFGLPLGFILLFALLRYSWAFLHSLILGATRAPVLSVEMLLSPDSGGRVMLSLMLALLLFVVSGAAAFWLGWLVASAVAAACIAALPAMLMLQGWTGTFKQTFSPAAIGVLLRILKWDYWIIVGCLTGLLILCAVALQQRDSLTWAVVFTLFVYSWLAVIAMAGGTIHQHRDEIAAQTQFVIRNETIADPRESERLREQALDDMYAACRAGASGNAWRTLQQYLQSQADAVHELEKLYQRISRWEFPTFINKTAQELISRLLVDQRSGAAIVIARERLAADRNFELKTTAERDELVRLCMEVKDQSTAYALLKRR
jgi:hypothetical protein